MSAILADAICLIQIQEQRYNCFGSTGAGLATEQLQIGKIYVAVFYNYTIIPGGRQWIRGRIIMVYLFDIIFLHILPLNPPPKGETAVRKKKIIVFKNTSEINYYDCDSTLFCRPTPFNSPSRGDCPVKSTSSYLKTFSFPSFSIAEKEAKSLGRRTLS